VTVGRRSLDDQVVGCRACPRLVGWREQVAQDKRRSYADQEYWGRPVPGFGPADAAVLVVGLAPAAHGANRTGRMFTGDRSGEWLYASLFRVGLANQPTSTSRDDGLSLRATRVTAAVHCAPPGNKPTTAERDACASWFERELQLVAPTLEVVVALGGFAWTSVLAALGHLGHEVPRPRPRFCHGAEVPLGPYTLLGSYHPSQQNTFTGRLTEPMLDDVLRRAALAGSATPSLDVETADVETGPRPCTT
jgi:uracil-DNA glycosylase family 4